MGQQNSYKTLIGVHLTCIPCTPIKVLDVKALLRQIMLLASNNRMKCKNPEGQQGYRVTLGNFSIILAPSGH